MKVTVLGARGSMPVEGKSVLKYGGATSCILVESDTEAIFIDAGTGILDTPDIGDKNITVILTHAHLDHLMGLPFFPYLSQKNRRIDFYAPTCEGLNATEILRRLFSPPYWPCTLDEYASDLRCHDLTLPMRIGDILVEGIESNHPGGSLIYKLTCNNRSMVCATDYEYDEEKSRALIDFAKGVDLLFFDAQYTDEQLALKKGFGHSSALAGLKVMKECGARLLRLVHHDPFRSDEELQKMEADVKSASVAFAGKGDVITL